MPNTTISSLPYPALLDAPNGPTQIEGLARAVEPRLVNYYDSKVTRDAAITFPVKGMLTYRADDGLFEYWTGKAWVGAYQGVPLSIAKTVEYGTDINLTTKATGAIGNVSITLTNPSKIYSMVWAAAANYTCIWKWNAQNILVYSNIYFKNGAAAVGGRALYEYTGEGTQVARNYSWPWVTGTLTPGSSVVLQSYMTMYRSAGSGTVTFQYGNSTISVIGVPSV